MEPRRDGIMAECPMDDGFLDRLRRGDGAAYEVVLNRYEGPVFRFFYYSHGDRELAEDQSGETFARLVGSVRRMQGDAGALRAYLFGIARNVLRADRRRPRPRFEEAERMESVADPMASQAARVAAREEFERALAVIRAFPSPMRQVFLLRFVEELTLQEVAEALSMPVNSVKSHIHRGRRRLRELVGADETGKNETVSTVARNKAR